MAESYEKQLVIMDMNERVVHVDVCTIQSCEDGVIIRLPLMDSEKDSYSFKHNKDILSATSIEGMLHLEMRDGNGKEKIN